MQSNSQSHLHTGSGILAVVIWSMSISLGRSLTEKVGMFTAGGSIYLLSGIISITYYLAINRSNFRNIMNTSPRYMFTCGSCFVLYLLFLYSAIGLAANRQQVIEVGLLNSLWPVFTLIFSIPVLQNKIRPACFLIGILVSFSGVILASTTINKMDFSIQSLCLNVRNNFPSYFFAFSAAVLWGLYSNFVRRFHGLANNMTVPLFLFFSGVLLWVVGIFFPVQSNWNTKAFFELMFLVFFSGTTGYVLWECAARKGNLIFVASFAYLMPLFSTIATGLYLGVKLDRGIWIAGGMVVAGAVISNFSIIETVKITTIQKKEVEYVY